MGIINIIIFDDDELTHAMADSYLKEVSFPFQLFIYKDFKEDFIPSNSENIIFVKVNNTNSDVLNSIEKLSSNKNNNFVIISNDNSTDFHVKALRTGAKNFLLKPIAKSDFLSVIHKITNNEVLKKQGGNMANIYSVISPEAGMGKTFFIVNLAKEIADVNKDKVLIIDFNNSINDISIMLDINSKYNTSFILNAINQQNAKELLSKLERYEDSSLYIMANGLYTNSLGFTLEQFKLFLQEASEMYKYIFFDLNSNMANLNKFILDKSNHIYCLLDMKVNEAEKAKNDFLRNGLYSKVRFIVNRYRERDKDRLQEVETMIEKQVYCKIPQSAMAASMSMQKGKTLKEMYPKLDIVKIYKNLALNVIHKD